MAQVPSLTSQARAAELNAANAARARMTDGELADVSELPSAKPVSLGDFPMRTQTNNKGPKQAKLFPQDHNKPMEVSAGPRDCFRRLHHPVERYFPPAAPPSPAYHQPHLMSPQIAYYSRYPYHFPDYQYPMYHGMHYYQQMYPGQLSYYPMMPVVPTGYQMVRSPSPVEDAIDKVHNQSRSHFTSQEHLSLTKPRDHSISIKPSENGHDRKQGALQQAPGLAYSSSDGSSKMNEPGVHSDISWHGRRQHQFPPSTPKQTTSGLKNTAKNQPQTPPDQILDSSRIQFSGPETEHEINHPSSSEVNSRSPPSGTSSHSVLRKPRLKLAPPLPILSMADKKALLAKNSTKKITSTTTLDVTKVTAKALSTRDAGVGSYEKHSFQNTTGSCEANFHLFPYMNDSPHTPSGFERDVFKLDDPFAPDQGERIYYQSRSPSPKRDPSTVKRYEPLINKYDKDAFCSEKSRKEEVARIFTEATKTAFSRGPIRINIPGSRSAHSYEGHLSTGTIDTNATSKMPRPPGLEVSCHGPASLRTSDYYDRILDAEDWFHQGNNLQYDLPLGFVERLNRALGRMESGTTQKAEPTTTIQTWDAFSRAIANLYSYSGNQRPGSVNLSGTVSDSYHVPRYSNRHSHLDNKLYSRQRQLQPAPRLLPDSMLETRRTSTSAQGGMPPAK